MIKWKNLSVSSVNLSQKSQNDTFNHFLTAHFQNCVYLILLPQRVIGLYKTKYFSGSGLLAFKYICSSFSLKKAVPGGGHTSGHTSHSECLKNGTLQVAERNSCRYLWALSLGLALTGKIPCLFTWKVEFSLPQGFAGVLLVALSVIKHLALCGGAMYRQTFSVL